MKLPDNFLLTADIGPVTFTWDRAIFQVGWLVGTGRSGIKFFLIYRGLHWSRGNGWRTTFSQ